VSFGDIAKEFSEVHKDPPRLQVWTNTKLTKLGKTYRKVMINRINETPRKFWHQIIQNTPFTGVDVHTIV
jgi:hypothetical protein